jgi:hypothetical protein
MFTGADMANTDLQTSLIAEVNSLAYQTDADSDQRENNFFHMEIG